MRILLAYATKRGSTREVAAAIMSALLGRGPDVDLRPACNVDDLAAYDAVVLGGALYLGRWHPDARRFLRRQRVELRERPFAVFALGPLTLEPGDVDGSRKQLERALARMPELHPVAIGVFGGVVDPKKLRFPFTRMPASDARDWEAIEAWADDVAGKVSDTAPVRRRSAV